MIFQELCFYVRALQMDFLPVQLPKRRADGSSYLSSHLPLPHLQKEGMKWCNVTVGGTALLPLPLPLVRSNPNGGHSSFLVGATPRVRCQGGEQSQSARRANSLSCFCHTRMMLGEADGNCAALSITHCDVFVSCVGSKKGRGSVEFSHCRL